MSDTMNNFANNTNELYEDAKPFTDMIQYWNFYHVDELITTDWLFYNYIDNLSFLGGLLDILLLIPSGIMIIYTFRFNEINILFF
jgi:hypothetical protein